MPLYQSTVNTGSEQFRQNRRDMLERIEHQLFEMANDTIIESFGIDKYQGFQSLFQLNQGKNFHRLLQSPHSTR